MDNSIMPITLTIDDRHDLLAAASDRFARVTGIHNSNPPQVSWIWLVVGFDMGQGGERVFLNCDSLTQ
jgi:hypothetical protein